MYYNLPQLMAERRAAQMSILVSVNSITELKYQETLADTDYLVLADPCLSDLHRLVNFGPWFPDVAAATTAIMQARKAGGMLVIDLHAAVASDDYHNRLSRLSLI